MKESDIVYESGDFWVSKDSSSYIVWKANITHSVSDSSYPITCDGLSLAKARFDYLSKNRLKTNFSCGSVNPNQR